MYSVNLGGTATQSLVSIGTNISSENASIQNASINSLSAVEFKTAVFSPHTLNTSVLNISAINLDPNFVFPILNVSTLNSVEESFVNVSAVNISANQITADNIQPLLTAGDNISILNNRISALNNNLPATGNFTTLNTTQINASNLSTGDLTFGSNFTLSDKFLTINSTTNITENSGDLITSGAVYNAINRFSTNISDGRSLTNTKLIEGGDVIKPIIPGTTSSIDTEVPAGTSKNIMKVFYTTKFGENSILSVVANFGYQVSGDRGDKITARLEYNNGSNNNIGQQEQMWTDDAGGGTRSGVLSPRQGVRRSAVPAQTQVYFQIIIQNDSDDTFTFLTPDACNFHITESLDNAGSDLNLNTGDLQADSANFNSLAVQAGSGSGQATIGKTYLGNNAFGNMACLSVNGNDGANNYGFAQVANNQTIMNAMPTAYNSFRCENVEVASIGQIGLGIGLGQNNTASFPLEVSGDTLVSGIMFANEIDTADADITNISNTNLSGTNATFQEINVSGNLIVNGTTFTTTNLTAGENVNISNNVISAFFGSGGQVNLNYIQVDGGVDIGGVLNVSQTSTFGGSLNVSNIIYSGVAGQHEGGLVLYSNVLGNNFTQGYDSSGDEVNITATGSATAINYFVGGTNVLRIAQGTFQVLNLQADDITAETLSVVELTGEIFECIDGKATFRFNTPLLNAATANISVLTLHELLTDDINVNTINAFNGNFSVAFANQLNASTCVLTDIGADEITANYVQSNTFSAVSSFTSPVGDIGNISSTNICATEIDSTDANFSTYSFIAGVGDDLDLNDLVVNNTINASVISSNEMNTSTITADTLTLTSSEFPLTIPNGQLNVRQINISRSLLMEGSDAFFGSATNASNVYGGLPRSRLNFWSNTLFEMGMRFGVTEENKTQLKLETEYGNVSIFNININNTSTMDMDSVSTTFHNTLNAEDANFSNINTSNFRSNSVNTFSFNLSDQTSSAQSMTMERDGGAVVITNNAGSITFNTNTNSTARAMIMDSNNLIQTRTIQNATLLESRNISTDDNVSVGGSLSVAGIIEGYQETLIAGTNITIVGNTISSAGEPLPSDANFSTITSQTTNTSVLNTSFINCLDEASFSNGINVNGAVSSNSLDADEIFTSDSYAFVYNISNNLDDTEASLLIRNGDLTEFISTGGRLRFSCNEIQTSGVANFSTLIANNLSTATMALSSDFALDAFSNTLQFVGTTGTQAIQDIETNGLTTTSVNTSSLNVDGFATMDILGVNIAMDALVGNINTINSSGTANISLGNFSTIDVISGNIDTFNTLTINASSVLADTGTITTINSTTSNSSTINTSNIVMNNVNGFEAITTIAIGIIGLTGSVNYGKGISSVSHPGTGQYTCNFDFTLPDIDYVVQLTLAEGTTRDDLLITFDSATLTTTGFSYSIHEQDNGGTAGVYRDRAHFVSVFR